MNRKQCLIQKPEEELNNQDKKTALDRITDLVKVTGSLPVRFIRYCERKWNEQGGILPQNPYAFASFISCMKVK